MVLELILAIVVNFNILTAIRQLLDHPLLSNLTIKMSNPRHKRSMLKI